MTNEKLRYRISPVKTVTQRSEKRNLTNIVRPFTRTEDTRWPQTFVSVNVTWEKYKMTTLVIAMREQNLDEQLDFDIEGWMLRIGR